MPINKNALLRYMTLDKCFGDRSRMYFMEDLINKCTEAIDEFSKSGIREAILSSRQIFLDIKFMESERGYGIELQRTRVKTKHHKKERVYYRYKDPSFSIRRNQTLNDSEAMQLKETLLMLNRFKGFQELAWIEEMSVRIETAFRLNKSSTMSIVEFQQNPYLKGLVHFQDLFNAINNSTVLDITYQGYKQDASQVIRIHPYFLKQYNNRWFMFGLNNELGRISNLAIDRIISVETCHFEPFIENNLVDFNTHFEDIVGVTVYENAPIEKIVLEIDAKRWPYIFSKPLHGSQKVISKSAEKVTISLELKINNELETLILSYGADIKVVQPESLVKSISENISKLFYKYSEQL